MNEQADQVGLCRRCVHARTVNTPRSVFWRCSLSDTDPRFDRYPRLPVLACEGFTPGPVATQDESPPSNAGE